MEKLLRYILLANFAAFIAFAIDKQRAQRKSTWRTPEVELWAFALFGGAPGALLAMKVFHHKTHKPAFRIGMPILVVVQIVFIGYCILKGFGYLG